MRSIWDELKNTIEHIVPWAVALALGIFAFQQQAEFQRTEVSRQTASIEALTDAVRQMERLLSQHGLVVPPFRAGGFDGE